MDVIDANRRVLAGDTFFALLDADDASDMLGICGYDAATMVRAALMLCRLAYLDRTEPWSEVAA